MSTRDSTGLLATPNCSHAGHAVATPLPGQVRFGPVRNGGVPLARAVPWPGRVP